MAIIRVIIALLLLTCGALSQPSQSGAYGSAPDPYVLDPGNGEPGCCGLSGDPGFRNTNGRVPKSSVLAAPSTTAVIITTWQSLIESASAGTFTTVNATANNFNIYDGGIYNCANPVLGTPYSTALGSNSANCQIADSLVTAGTYTQAIVVPIAVGGSLCSDWTPGGKLYQRIVVTMKRLQARGLTAATGFTGHVWIVPHGGEADNTAGTPRATLAACIRNYAQAFVDNGSGTARFFVPTESMLSNVTNAIVTNAQADAVASGCSTCRAGANVDSLTTGTNRQADGTHLTQTGAANLSALDVTVITNCKNTAC